MILDRFGPAAPGSPASAGGRNRRLESDRWNLICPAEVFAGRPGSAISAMRALWRWGSRICRKAPCRPVRPDVNQRLHHWRLGGIPLDRLRGRRRSVATAVAAPQVEPGQGILPRVLRTYSDGRGAAPAPRHPSRPADEGVETLAGVLLRNHIPAALQRQGCTRALGEKRGLNRFTDAVIAVLVILPLILTVSVLRASPKT